MIQLPNYSSFIADRQESALITEGIIGSLIAGVSGFVKGAIKGLISPFSDMLRDIKQSWKDGVTAEKVRDTLIESIEKSLMALAKEVQKATSIEDIQQLLEKAAQINANMGETIKKAMNQVAEAQSATASVNIVNEDAVGNARVGMDIASSIVDKALNISGKSLRALIEKAKAGAKAGMELEKFKNNARTQLIEMAKQTKAAIMKLDTTELLRADDGKEKEAAEIEDRKKKKYKKNQHVRYINNAGNKVIGLVRKDLGDKVQFFSASDATQTFIKNKVDIIGQVSNDDITKED